MDSISCVHHLDHMPVCVVALNPSSLKVEAVNREFERVMGEMYKFQEGEFWGFASNDLNCQVFKDFLQQQIGLLEQKPNEKKGEQEEKEGNLASNDNSLSSKKSNSNKLKNLEMLALGIAEGGLPIKRHFDWTAGFGADGKLILFGDMCSEYDVEQRKKDREIIDFLQNAPIAMHWLSGEGIVLWANNTELQVLGYTAEEYIGQPIMKFCPDEEELVLEIFKTLGSGRTIKDVPVRFRTKDGRIVDLLIDSNVAYHDDGSFHHTRCFIRDDTGRKIREASYAALLAESKRSLQVLDGFMSRTLQRFSNPLHSLQQACDVIISNLNAQQARFSKDTPKIEIDQCLENSKLIENANRTIYQASQLLKDVAEIVRFEQGAELDTTEDLLNLPKLVDEVASECLERFGSIHDLGSFDVIVREGCPVKMRTDPSVLRKCLLELLSNALSASVAGPDSKGKVMLEVNGNADEAIFRVSNNGLVFQESMMDGIERYYLEMPKKKALHDVTEDDEKVAKQLRNKVLAESRNRTSNKLGIGFKLTYHRIQALGGELLHIGKKNEPSSPAEAKEFTTTFQFSIPINLFGRHERFGRIKRAQPVHNLGEHEVNLSMPSSSSSSSSMSDFSFTRFRSDTDCSFTDSEASSTDVAQKGAFDSVAKPHILIVEDTQICALTLQRTLGKIGCSTEVAENGQIAVDKVKNATPGLYSLILMDIRMPVMDGIQATNIIVNELNVRDVPIVCISGEVDAGVQKEIVDAGARELLKKPCKKKLLQQTLQKYLSI